MTKPRAILFVDGENLVMRYQTMVAAGRTPRENVKHRKDVFVWHDSLTNFFDHGVMRACYYTSVVGDEARVTEVKAELAALRYMYFPPHRLAAYMAQVTPVVFKKPAQSQKTRNVDIQIVIDVMRYATGDAYDHLLLASGDGDYLPLISEAMRAGKQVHVAAFSSGLHPAIAHSVDKFIDLDELFFHPQPAA